MRVIQIRRSDSAYHTVPGLVQTTPTRVGPPPYLTLPLLSLLILAGPGRARAQIDPVERQLVQVGYNAAFEGDAPQAGYAFYYYNQPDCLQTNLTFRLALAPTYLDSEFGFVGLLGEYTDLGIGLAGGGFADNYWEIRQGQYLQSESFDGYGGEGSVSIYHLFNPE